VVCFTASHLSQKKHLKTDKIIRKKLATLFSSEKAEIDQKKSRKDQELKDKICYRKYAKKSDVQAAEGVQEGEKGRWYIRYLAEVGMLGSS
jgi:hypothetical protein